MSLTPSAYPLLFRAHQQSGSTVIQAAEAYSSSPQQVGYSRRLPTRIPRGLPSAPKDGECCHC